MPVLLKLNITVPLVISPKKGSEILFTYHLNYLSYERIWCYDSLSICSTPFIKFLVVQLSLEDNVDFQYLHDM